MASDSIDGSLDTYTPYDYSPGHDYSYDHHSNRKYYPNGEYHSDEDYYYSDDDSYHYFSSGDDSDDCKCKKKHHRKKDYRYHSGAYKHKRGHHKRKPRYCKRKPWPPPCKPKHGNDITVGNITANNIDADVVKAPPQRIYVPSDDYKTLGEALTSMVAAEQGGPLGGYHIILRNGTHYISRDYNLPITNLVLEAERWTPTMSNAYIAGHGHSMSIITRYFDFYNKCVGGLGPYTIDLCKDRITVCGKNGQFNPDFSSVRCGDHIYWRSAGGRIDCYKVVKGSCNIIWIDGCIGSCKVKMGEGFWIANTTKVTFRGQRQLLLAPSGNLQYRGIHLSMSKDDICDSDRRQQIVTGASKGVTQMIHSHMEDNILINGGPSWLTPNIVRAQVRFPAGSTGNVLYTAMINRAARVILDQALVLFAGSLLLGNEVGLETWGSAAANLIGSTAHDCELAVMVLGGTFNCPGTVFNSCKTGIRGRSGGKIISTVTEFEGLAPLALTACELALDFDNKIAAESDIVITKDNINDLLIDGDFFPKLNQYPSGDFRTRASTYFYTQND